MLVAFVLLVMGDDEMTKIDVSNLVISSKQPDTWTVYTADFENCTWKFTVASALGYLLQPLVLPIMIILSRLLKRRIKFLPFGD